MHISKHLRKYWPAVPVILLCVGFSLSLGLRIAKPTKSTPSLILKAPAVASENLPYSVYYNSTLEPIFRDNYGLADTIITPELLSKIDGSPDAAWAATFWNLLTLKALNASELTRVSPQIRAYILSNLNPATMRFEQTINYSLYDTDVPEAFLHVPFTAELTHLRGIIMLGELGFLQETFSALQIATWMEEIFTWQNPDGGFGTRTPGMSTLTETYYATYALMWLTDFATNTLSPDDREALEGFMLSLQYPEGYTLSFLTGAFRENSDEPGFGWSDYYANYLACRIIHLIGLETSLFAANFATFVNAGMFIPADGLYADSFPNQNSGIGSIYGSAMAAGCLRMLNLEASFPELYTVQSNLLQSSFYQVAGVSEGPDYFVQDGDSDTIDPFVQHAMVEYLGEAELLGSLDADGTRSRITDTVLSMQTASGGFTYFPMNFLTPKTAAVVSDVLNNVNNPLIDEEADRLYQEIHLRDTGENFAYFPNITASYPQAIRWQMIEFDYLPPHDHVENSYWALSALTNLGKLCQFASDKGDLSPYSIFIADSLRPDGSFPETFRFEGGDGTLETQYYALKSIDLLCQAQGSGSIAGMFSVLELTRMAAFAESYIFEDETTWHAAGEKFFQNTFYLQQIMELLGNGFRVDQEKLFFFLSESLAMEQEFNTDDRIWLFKLAVYNELTTPCASEALHLDVESKLEDIERSWYMEINKLTLLSTLWGYSPVEVFIYYDFPLHPGQIATFRLGFHTPFSPLLPAEITGFVFADNSAPSVLNHRYLMVEPPGFNPFNPFVWNPVLSFIWHGYTYEMTLEFHTEFTLLSSASSSADGSEIVFTYIIQADPMIRAGLLPLLDVVCSLNGTPAVIDRSNITISQSGLQSVVTWVFTSSEFGVENDTQVRVEFGYGLSWLLPVFSEFEWAAPEGTGTDPEPEPAPEPVPDPDPSVDVPLDFNPNEIASSSIITFAVMLCAVVPGVMFVVNKVKK